MGRLKTWPCRLFRLTYWIDTASANTPGAAAFVHGVVPLPGAWPLAALMHIACHAHRIKDFSLRRHAKPGNVRMLDAPPVIPRMGRSGAHVCARLSTRGGSMRAVVAVLLRDLEGAIDFCSAYVTRHGSYDAEMTTARSLIQRRFARVLAGKLSPAGIRQHAARGTPW